MIEWQYLFAASLYAIVPVVILFVGIEKNLVGGLTSGGVKGDFYFFPSIIEKDANTTKGCSRQPFVYASHHKSCIYAGFFAVYPIFFPWEKQCTLLFEYIKFGTFHRFLESSVFTLTFL